MVRVPDIFSRRPAGMAGKGRSAGGAPTGAPRRIRIFPAGSRFGGIGPVPRKIIPALSCAGNPGATVSVISCSQVRGRVPALRTSVTDDAARVELHGVYRGRTESNRRFRRRAGDRRPQIPSPHNARRAGIRRCRCMVAFHIVAGKSCGCRTTQRRVASDGRVANRREPRIRMATAGRVMMTNIIVCAGANV